MVICHWWISPRSECDSTSHWTRRPSPKSVPVLAFPVRLDLAYQYQKLEARTFDLYDRRSPSFPQPYESVEAEGDVHVFSGSITLKF